MKSPHATEQKRIKAIKRVVREAEELTGNVATGQTVIRAALKQSVPIVRLIDKLNTWEQTAAYEILRAHVIAGGVTSIRDPLFGTGEGSTRTDAADDNAVRRIDTLDKFRIWQKELKQTHALIAVTGILLDEMPLREVAAVNKWSHGVAFKHFQAGLRHFAALRGNVPRGEKWRLPVGGRK